jgi:hypothetical protein
VHYRRRGGGSDPGRGLVLGRGLKTCPAKIAPMQARDGKEARPI